MPSNFKNAATLIGSASTDIYTAPASTESVVHAAWFANLSSTDQITVTITWRDDSTATTHTLAKDAPIPVGDTLILDKPLNLEAADKISASCSSNNNIECTLAVLEKT